MQKIAQKALYILAQGQTLKEKIENLIKLEISNFSNTSLDKPKKYSIIVCCKHRFWLFTRKEKSKLKQSKKSNNNLYDEKITAVIFKVIKRR